MCVCVCVCCASASASASACVRALLSQAQKNLDVSAAEYNREVLIAKSVAEAAAQKRF